MNPTSDAAGRMSAGRFCLLSPGKSNFYFKEFHMKKLAVVGIIVSDRDRETGIRIQSILSEFGDMIIGRMGVPDRESGFSAISVIVKGSVEKISALTGRLGQIANVNVKSAAITQTETE